MTGSAPGPPTPCHLVAIYEQQNTKKKKKGEHKKRGKWEK